MTVNPLNCLSVDVEDWFNILDTNKAPLISDWGNMDIRFIKSLEKLLQLFSKYNVKSTFFWLGWFGERYPKLVKACYEAGHEIASHGYGHVLAYQVGRNEFVTDIVKGKNVLEDIIGDTVKGFRAAGFSTSNETSWAFDEIKAAGYIYDSSIFPASRGHGGMIGAELAPHFIQTPSGPLLEFPQSMINIMGHRFSFFGGGYLRLAPLSLIKVATKKLHKLGRPLIVYIHPREIDPSHPRLPLPLIRRFKCYVNLESTFKKLEWFCTNISFTSMIKMAEAFPPSSN